MSKTTTQPEPAPASVVEAGTVDNSMSLGPDSVEMLDTLRDAAGEGGAFQVYRKDAQAKRGWSYVVTLHGDDVSLDEISRHVPDGGDVRIAAVAKGPDGRQHFTGSEVFTLDPRPEDLAEEPEPGADPRALLPAGARGFDPRGENGRFSELRQAAEIVSLLREGGGNGNGSDKILLESMRGLQEQNNTLLATLLQRQGVVLPQPAVDDDRHAAVQIAEMILKQSPDLPGAAVDLLHQFIVKLTAAPAAAVPAPTEGGPADAGGGDRGDLPRTLPGRN